ncbi:hypothetical protein PsAD5_00127 [Pseudovibrio sp. Ad5]|uniref:hypothetical protein n=1 Tax=Pseudovibrio sp. Ad5 TaxID=989436 RepID=UPI0007AE3E26|nr:hypothetical protein [Pseudovibrio sp. Ad5]KZL02178.1 hypothetical protein PsAD5_00127 [Pseudovibrio sp. Ad5]
MKLWKEMDSVERVQALQATKAFGATISQFAQERKCSQGTVSDFLARRNLKWSRIEGATGLEVAHAHWIDLGRRRRYEALRNAAREGLSIEGVIKRHKVQPHELHDFLQELGLAWEEVAESELEVKSTSRKRKNADFEEIVIPCDGQEEDKRFWRRGRKDCAEFLNLICHEHEETYWANKYRQSAPDARGYQPFNIEAYQASLSGEWKAEDYRAAAQLDQAKRLARQPPVQEAA